MGINTYHRISSCLQAENEYTKAVMADTKELQEKLFKELRGRIKEDDNSVPERYATASISEGSLLLKEFANLFLKRIHLSS